MEKTIRLFDTAPYGTQFDATVLSCEREGDGFDIVLDRTLFFPEEGGQSADTGTLGGIPVTGVSECGGVIRHRVDAPLPVGETVTGELDFAARFRKMQNHTGEHILSALAHTLFGLRNVGFHLGTQDVTADFDGELRDAQVLQMETRANEIVAECRPVRGYYPATAALAHMEYRAKLALAENVRIVEIEGVDLCACCAPHVANTGEIGMIKILSHERYKGGTRLHFRCGYDALDAYRADLAQVKQISKALSVKQGEIAEGVARLQGECEQLRIVLAAAKRELLACKLEKIEATEGNLVLFETDADANTLRYLVSGALPKCKGLCAAFSGADGAGYKYVIAANGTDLRALSKEINAALNGRGGGSPQMIQGSCNATRDQIEAYFAK